MSLPGLDCCSIKPGNPELDYLVSLDCRNKSGNDTFIISVVSEWLSEQWEAIQNI